MIPLPRIYVVASLTLAIALGGVLLSYGVQHSGPQPHAIPFRAISQGWGMGSDQVSMGQANILINNDSNWTVLWTKAFCPAELTSCPSPPYVNFTSETAIAIFAGVKPTGGYALNITSVSLVGSSMKVQATLTEPSKSSCVVTQALTNPFEIIAVPKTTSSLMLETQNVVTNC